VFSKFRIAFCFIMLAPASSTMADDNEASRADVILLRHCEVHYEFSTLVGVVASNLNSSFLQDCYVHLGDRVKAGQVLGRITDRDLQVEREMRKIEAQTTLDISASEMHYAVALQRQKRSEELKARGLTLVSDEEYRIQTINLKAASVEIGQAKRAQSLAQLRLQDVEVRIRFREFVSPHDGVVVEIRKNIGEAFNPHEPVFRVVADTRLKVIGHLNLADYWRVKPGQRVRVTPEIDGADLPVERETFMGHVVFVDSRIDPLTRTCEIVTLIENRDGWLASGLEARMEVMIDSNGSPEPISMPAGKRVGSLLDLKSSSDSVKPLAQKQAK
jgi:multidrug efflux pump subunit AcrA (membrane-fusion protein)